MSMLHLYDAPRAPSPRRVRIFLAEKGITVPTTALDLGKGEQFSAEYRAINPGCTLPALVLPDGRVIANSHAICRYFEGTHPEPPLMGRDPVEQAQIEQWTHQIEEQGYQAAATFLRHTRPAFAERSIPGVRGGFPQIAALGDHAKRLLTRLLASADTQLSAHRFLTGETFTMADIALLIALDFGKRMEVERPAHVQRWYVEVSARPSAQA
ncbi:MAG: glutathione S-transferase family protein [Deltaproteobacteria bacterium]|nr:glutathione S-transferase family protein [Deltaproteobacteria bacterium]